MFLRWHVRGDENLMVTLRRIDRYAKHKRVGDDEKMSNFTT